MGRDSPANDSAVGEIQNMSSLVGLVELDCKTVAALDCRCQLVRGFVKTTQAVSNIAEFERLVFAQEVCWPEVLLVGQLVGRET